MVERALNLNGSIEQHSWAPGQGEFLTVRWQDIDWTFARISVRRTLVRLKEQGLFREPNRDHLLRPLGLRGPLT
jgi:hypothetical protein